MLSGLRLDIPAALALALLGLGPVLLCIDVERGTVDSMEQLRRHRSPASASREVTFTGLARGSPGSSRVGRPCLAWESTVYASRRQQAGSRTELVQSRVCGSVGQEPLQIEAPDGQRLRLDPTTLALRLSGHEARSPYRGTLADCAGLTKADLPTATVREACLQEGDRVEVWACRDGDRLVPCGDRGDFIASPPGKNPMEQLRSDERWGFCCGAGWLALLSFAALALLGDRLRFTHRAEPRG